MQWALVLIALVARSVVARRASGIPLGAEETHRRPVKRADSSPSEWSNSVCPRRACFGQEQKILVLLAQVTSDSSSFSLTVLRFP
ncbi:hypothetical protein GE061_015048 [Apolygus lucorum]|uniref:Secreted protein n=1 Tax=Apolygus lucorum TaxID=248454 RepID=A0A8S9XJX3_APOLU|nr:hypothetical protein GE061_015048 [Apolygus lucorum]